MRKAMTLSDACNDNTAAMDNNAVTMDNSSETTIDIDSAAMVDNTAG